jgi:leader peptidase (prepilin peptidase) / N-methyltransferase
MFTIGIETWLISACLFIVGAIFGSFGNVLIYRIPEERMLGGRSHCPHCQVQLNMIDLIPLLGFLLRGGKCKYCKVTISRQYPLIELISALLFPTAFFIADAQIIPGILLGFALWLLLLMSVIDWRVQGIPDLLSIPFVLLGFSYGLLHGTVDPMSIGIGIAFFGTQWLVSHGMWVGSGDIVLIMGIGAIITPWPLMIFCILTAYIIGAFVASILLVTKIKSRKDHVAFGPFLAISMLLTLVAGRQIIEFMYGITV